MCHLTLDATLPTHISIAPRSNCAGALKPYAVTMDKFVAHLNIDHYRKLLAMELDEAKRKMIERLLAQEETKLAAQNHKNKNRQA
jgi:hypothetical protein